MCGIAGILNHPFGPTPSESELSVMISQLRHRGPDGFGFYSDDSIGLAHARLSIIDLEGGWQPIHNEDKTVWVVFNGEIFNYIELRQTLERYGHSFYTHSDTEVIVHLYEQFGEEFIQHLNGQFAIALWDVAQRKLLLVRDRAGILPLFYTVQSERLFFASEVKALLPILGCSPRLNLSALDQLMTFWAPVSPQTMFQGVYEVSPGHLLKAVDGKLEHRRYWDWNFPQDEAYRRDSADDLAEELRTLLIDATRLRLRADVPVGAYLSGGIDSSVLAAIIRQQGDVSLRTFSIGFEDEDYDESAYQRRMIEHLDADHSRITCGNEDIAAAFEQTIFHAESPVLRTAPVPMSLLSGLVRAQGYKVVLTGEGADEVLGGYDIFKEAKIRQFWARNPASRWRPLLLQRLYPYLDISRGGSGAYLEAFFGMGLEQPNSPHFSHLTRWVSTSKCKEFFSADLRRQLNDDARKALEESLPMAFPTWHPFNRAQYIEAKSLMAGYLLCAQGDRMLMANSVEGRFPFLDHRVIEFANSIHPRLKMKVLDEKYLLKRAMGRLLPKEIVMRHKQPYRAPNVPAFFTGASPAYVKQMLDRSTIERYGYFDTDKVERLVGKVQGGRAIGNSDNMALVGILSTQIWHRLFIENYTRDFQSSTTSAGSVSLRKMAEV